jgi:hypothetical protein
MSSRPCACEGSNENCRYCFGSGSLPDSRSSIAPVRISTRRNTKVLTKTSEADKLHGHWPGLILDDSRRRVVPPEAITTKAPNWNRVLQQDSGDRQIRAARNPINGPTADLSSPRRVGPPKKSPKIVAQKQGLSRQLAVCEYCNMAVHPSHLRQHRYEAHGLGMRPVKPSRGPTQAPTEGFGPDRAKKPVYVLCPVCQWRLRETDVREHFEEVHAPRHSSKRGVPPKACEREATSAKQQAGASPSIQVKPGSNLVPCPKCPSSVRKDHLERHFRRVHAPGSNLPEDRASPALKFPSKATFVRGRQPKLTKKTTAGGNSRYRALSIGSGNSGPGHDDSDQRVAPVDNYWEDRRLDGSRDYSQIREDGRFGSHPSYDSCDDESAP